MEHPIIIDLLVLGLGLYLGSVFTSLYIKFSLEKEKEKYNNKIKTIYSEINDNVVNKKTNFLYRINNTVRFETNTPTLGLISVYFYLNKQEILIIKNDKALYTSSDLDSKLLSELDYTLRVLFSNEINDTINIFGTIYSRKYFTETFKINPNIVDLFSETESFLIKEEYDIDTILDKINLIGYDKLSDNEKDFLKKYSNN
jgi:hypothetical protein